MATDTCEFCSGDLIVVEGILGPQLFCPDCRRFQAVPTATYTKRTAKKVNEVPARESTPAQKTQQISR